MQLLLHCITSENFERVDDNVKTTVKEKAQEILGKFSLKCIQLRYIDLVIYGLENSVLVNCLIIWTFMILNFAFCFLINHSFMSNQVFVSFVH